MSEQPGEHGWMEHGERTEGGSHAGGMNVEEVVGAGCMYVVGTEADEGEARAVWVVKVEGKDAMGVGRGAVEAGRGEKQGATIEGVV